MKISMDDRGISMPHRKLAPGEARHRRWRRIQVGIALLLVLFAALDLSLGAWWAVPFLAVGVAMNTFMAVYNTRKLRALESASRKPDYSRIGELEREIYDETFRHDGAPELVSLPPGAQRDGSYPIADAGDLNAAIEMAGQGNRVWWSSSWGTASLPEGVALTFRTCENGHTIPGDLSCATCECGEEKV